MQTCPRCGSQAVDQAPYCPSCGHAMQGAPPQQGPGAGQQGKKTVLGISPDAPKPATVGKKTVMGMGLPTGEAPARQGVGHKTVLGMPMEAQPEAPVAAPVDPDPTIPDEPKVAAKNRTMMGIAPPEVAAAAQRVGNKTMLGGPALQQQPPMPSAQWQPPQSEPTRPQPWQPQQAQPQQPQQAQPQQAEWQQQQQAQWQQQQQAQWQQQQAQWQQQQAQWQQQPPQQQQQPQQAQWQQPQQPQQQAQWQQPQQPQQQAQWQQPQAQGQQQPPQQQAQGQQQPQAPAQISQKKTMLGVAMPGIAPTHEPKPAAPSPAAQVQPSQHKTMLGVAMPGIAPTHEPKPAAPSPAAQVQPSQQRTMMGVAMPGIAPTHEPRPQPVSPPYPAAHPAPPPPAPIPTEPKPKRRVVVATVPVYRRPAFVLAVLGVSVIVVVGLFVLLWPTKPPISSRAMVNDEGKDVLRLSCPTCPDGTVMTIEGATANVAAGEADLTLSRPLAVGDNRFTVQIDRPGSGRDESVELHMPVAFRVRPDLSGLEGDPPTFHVEVEAAPETSILIDGTAVKLDANGKARYPVDVSAECSGENAEVATIDRKVPYTIQPKGGKPSSGTVAVKVGISPLTLQAPRPHMVVDSEHFLVAGRTARGALVEIEGAKFAAGADGTFSRKMQIKRPGETKVRVRARLPEHAPRTITFTVKRVDDLEGEAKTFEARAATDVRALMENAEAYRDKEVAVQGEIVEARTQGFVRIVLLDTGGQCSKPPCLARLVYAGTQSLSKGDVVRVFGRVAGTQAAGGKSVPDIDVDFLLKGR